MEGEKCKRRDKELRRLKRSDIRAGQNRCMCQKSTFLVPSDGSSSARAAAVDLGVRLSTAMQDAGRSVQRLVRHKRMRGKTRLENLSRHNQFARKPRDGRCTTLIFPNVKDIAMNTTQLTLIRTFGKAISLPVDHRSSNASSLIEGFVREQRLDWINSSRTSPCGK